MQYNGKKVPSVVIKRLPRYYRYLGEFLQQDIKRISSGVLSEKMNVTASQIRQDFNYFGGFGQQGYGYNVEHLYLEIGKILGLHEEYKTMIVGAGHLGHALAAHTGFAKRGFQLSGIFDVAPEVVGTKIGELVVRHIDEMEQFVRENKIEIAILATPRGATQEMANRLVDCGIKGLWNFSNVELKLDRPVAVENVHMSDSLMTLSCKIKQESKIGE